MKRENKVKFAYARGGLLLAVGTLFASVCSLCDSMWKFCFFPFYYNTVGETNRTAIGRFGLWVLEKLAIRATIIASSGFAKYVEANLDLE